jgi:hypothetical protein
MGGGGSGTPPCVLTWRALENSDLFLRLWTRWHLSGASTIAFTVTVAAFISLRPSITTSKVYDAFFPQTAMNSARVT